MSEIDSSPSYSLIYLDVGNSRLKAVRYVDAQWLSLSARPITELTTFAEDVKAKAGPDFKLVVASVRADINEQLKAHFGEDHLQFLTIKDAPAGSLDYDTPATLGIDRYLACLGAKPLSDGAVVVIDAGSACTIDYMNADGVYEGGIIMPGMDAILSIFKTKAPELPPIEIALPEEWPGKSTTSSLQWGQVGFFLDGLHGALQRYQQKKGDFDLFLTGGSASVIEKLMEWKGQVNENLVYEGMRELIRLRSASK